MPATDHDAHRKPAPTLTRDLSPPPTSRTPPPQLNRPTANDVQPATPASSPVTPEPLPVTAAETLPEPEPPKPQEDGLGLDEIDWETFQQILDLDDDGRDFSRGMAWAYFSQADQTFKEMDEALERKDLAKLSSLGHFLKGSSAALGVAKVQASCEKIQHYGQQRDEETDKDLSEEDALSKIDQLLGQVKKEYNIAEQWLKKWYEDHPDPDPEP